MKFGVVNKSTIVNKFVLHILQRNITHLAVITLKTSIILGILNEGNWKRAENLALVPLYPTCEILLLNLLFTLSHCIKKWHED